MRNCGRYSTQSTKQRKRNSRKPAAKVASTSNPRFNQSTTVNLVTRSGQPPFPQTPHRDGFVADFRRFFMRGIATILPTLITIWLLLWLWNFLWDSIGKNVIEFICWAWFAIGNRYPAWFQTWHAIRFYYLSE